MEEEVGGRPVTPALGPCRAFSPIRPCPVVAWILKQVSGGAVGNQCCIDGGGGEGGGGGHTVPRHVIFSIIVPGSRRFQLSYLVGLGWVLGSVYPNRFPDHNHNPNLTPNSNRSPNSNTLLIIIVSATALSHGTDRSSIFSLSSLLGPPKHLKY